MTYCPLASVWADCVTTPKADTLTPGSAAGGKVSESVTRPAICETRTLTDRLSSCVPPAAMST